MPTPRCWWLNFLNCRVAFSDKELFSHSDQPRIYPFKIPNTQFELPNALCVRSLTGIHSKGKICSELSQFLSCWEPEKGPEHRSWPCWSQKFPELEGWTESDKREPLEHVQASSLSRAGPGMRGRKGLLPLALLLIPHFWLNSCSLYSVIFFGMYFWAFSLPPSGLAPSSLCPYVKPEQH